MSDEKPASEPKETSVEETKDDVQTNRPPEEYAKRLVEVSEEAKKYRQKLSEERKHKADLEKRLADIEQQKLQEQGKHKELAESYKKEADEWKKKYETTQQSYAYEAVTSQLRTEAVRMGCVDVEALIQLAPMNELEVDDSFKVKSESLKSLLETVAKKRPYLFTKQAPGIKDGTPASKPEAPSLKNLSRDQLASLLVHKLTPQQ